MSSLPNTALRGGWLIITIEMKRETYLRVTNLVLLGIKQPSEFPFFPIGNSGKISRTY